MQQVHESIVEGNVNFLYIFFTETEDLSICTLQVGVLLRFELKYPFAAELSKRTFWTVLSNRLAGIPVKGNPYGFLQAPMSFQ